MTIDKKEIYKTSYFVREPVDEICNLINEDPSKKIIINGNRGTGKSVILGNLENRGLGSKNQTIMAQFDLITRIDKKVFDEKFYAHYYELRLALKLISYIKENYPLIYEAKFKDIETLLLAISNTTIKYMNDTFYNDEVELKRYLTTYEYTPIIIEKIKNSLCLESLNLAIDNFDLINGCDANAQKSLSKYFDLFDKSIISSDFIQSKKYDDRLLNKGYSLYTPEYTYEFSIVKEIIRKRIKCFNREKFDSLDYFDEENITDKIYRDLISKSNGDMRIIIDTLEMALSEIGNIKDDDNISALFSSTINYKITKLKELKKMDASKPKLYL